MDEEELRRHLEFECNAHNAALRSDAEKHGIPYEPLTFEEFARRRDASLERPRLKPCPFCGGEPKLFELGSSRPFHQVQCVCGVRGPSFVHAVHAVQGWNKMARRE